MRSLLMRRAGLRAGVEWSRQGRERSGQLFGGTGADKDAQCAESPERKHLRVNVLESGMLK